MVESRLPLGANITRATVSMGLPLHTLLMVDDNGGGPRHDGHLYMCESGCRVDEADDAAAALDKLVVGGIGAVISDVVMLAALRWVWTGARGTATLARAAGAPDVELCDDPQRSAGSGHSALPRADGGRCSLSDERDRHAPFW